MCGIPGISLEETEMYARRADGWNGLSVGIAPTFSMFSSRGYILFRQSERR